MVPRSGRTSLLQPFLTTRRRPAVSRRPISPPLSSPSPPPPPSPPPTPSSRRFFSSSFHPCPPHCPPPLLPPVCQFCARARESARRRIHPVATGRILVPRSLASRCLVRCFRCNVLSLVYTVKARRRRPIVESAPSSFSSSCCSSSPRHSVVELSLMMLIQRSFEGS